MGCDGGSIPVRIELVKTKKRPQKQDPTTIARIKWRSCAATKDPLGHGDKPLVACDLGNIYLKESLLRLMVTKKLPKEFNHIRSLKDLIPLNFHPNPAFEVPKPGCPEDALTAPFICPISLLETNGRHRFCVLRPCGHVLSERAIHELGDVHQCAVCQTRFEPDDVIALNGNEEDVAQLRERAIQRRIRAREARRERKRGRTAGAENASNSTSTTSTSTTTTTTTTSTEATAPTATSPPPSSSASSSSSSSSSASSSSSSSSSASFVSALLQRCRDEIMQPAGAEVDSSEHTGPVPEQKSEGDNERKRSRSRSRSPRRAAGHKHRHHRHHKHRHHRHRARSRSPEAHPQTGPAMHYPGVAGAAVAAVARARELVEQERQRQHDIDELRLRHRKHILPEADSSGGPSRGDNYRSIFTSAMGDVEETFCYQNQFPISKDAMY